MNQTKPELRPGIYRHYKGNEYEVIDVVCHSENEEWLVLYRPCYGDHTLWVRPYTMFTEAVVLKGEAVPRFAFVRQ